jgi:phosphoribosylglycinamide formyltransferase-1
LSTDRCKLAVLASGRGSNFEAIAQNCARDDFPAEVSCLVTDRRKAGAIEIAERFGISWHCVDAGTKRGRMQPGCEEEIVSILRSRGVQLVFLAGFMRILRGPLLEAFPERILNIHPSLLPSFKGLKAQEQALSYGVKVAGCSVHFVDDSVDGGPIIVQASVPVDDRDDVESLERKILVEEHRIASEAIEIVARGAYKIEGRRVLSR